MALSYVSKNVTELTPRIYRFVMTLTVDDFSIFCSTRPFVSPKKRIRVKRQKSVILHLRMQNPSTSELRS
jgi:hypothetical protein